jgi:hypothetical protein
MNSGEGPLAGGQAFRISWVPMSTLWSFWHGPEKSLANSASSSNAALICTIQQPCSVVARLGVVLSDVGHAFAGRAGLAPGDSRHGDRCDRCHDHRCPDDPHSPVTTHGCKLAAQRRVSCVPGRAFDEREPPASTRQNGLGPARCDRVARTANGSLRKESLRSGRWTPGGCGTGERAGRDRGDPTR